MQLLLVWPRPLRHQAGVETTTPNELTVLIVDDEQDLRDLVDFNLRQAGYRTRQAAGGASALASCRAERPDIIVLDLNLPDVSGLDVCRTLRAQPNTGDVPIVMLTARGGEIDRVVGFEAGADDYVVKPFSVRELVLRVDALRRRLGRARMPAPAASRLKAGPVELDVEGFLAYVGGKEVPLTLLEFRLLKFLVEGAGRVRTRESLLDQVWGYSSEVETRTVDTHVKRLRDKLGAAGDAIETVRGVGYRFRAGE
jgi:two-component system phosphate regulon response regulator PhoB